MDQCCRGKILWVLKKDFSRNAQSDGRREEKQFSDSFEYIYSYIYISR